MVRQRKRARERESRGNKTKERRRQIRNSEVETSMKVAKGNKQRCCLRNILAEILTGSHRNDYVEDMRVTLDEHGGLVNEAVEI